MERSHRAIQKLMQGQNFKSMEDLNAFLEQQVTGRRLEEYAPAASNPKERAQELAYDAMDAESATEALRLAREALELDPDNVDALLAQLQHTATDEEEQITQLRAIVAAGERSLGPEFFAENKGRFWGILETRPYMRARGELAEMLRYLDRHEEAITEYEAILELNPNDNQGVREPLLGLYLLTGRLDSARSLLEKFDKDVLAGMLWGAVFLHYLAGDRGKAIAAFRRARKYNRHMVSILTGRRSMPERGDAYKLGSEEEAAQTVSFLGEVAVKHPEAVRWMDQMNRKLV
jgi:tetratricopeptide (TPR) repeat protein